MLSRIKKIVLNRLWQHGQSVLEYAILLAIVGAACLTMALYVRRAVQGKLYKMEEQITAKMNETPQSHTIMDLI